MTTRRRARHEQGRTSIFPVWTRALPLVAAVLLAGAPSQGAFTEPRLALLRVTPYRSASGSVMLKLEGSFSFPDAVQLGLPMAITITQDQLSARFDLNGHVFTQIGGGPEQPAVGLGVMAVAQREITLQLPAGFAAGRATAQVTLTYEGKPVSSNRLGFDL